MRVCIDMLAAQTSGSRNRGIGNYTLGLTASVAMKLCRSNDELFLIADGLHGESLIEISRCVGTNLPSHRIKSVYLPRGEPFAQITNMACAGFQSASLDWAYGRINPDVLHISSLFENDVRFPSPSGGASTIASTTLYDLIPLLHANRYLADSAVNRWYRDRLLLLKRFDLLFSISASSRNDAINHLAISPDKIVNVMGACNPMFKPLEVSPDARTMLWEKYNIRRPFLMFTGGSDWRKNLDGAIQSYAMQIAVVRKRFCLVIVCSIDSTERDRLKQVASKAGLEEDELIITGFVSNEDLVALYRTAHAFVFPSFYEGFGLPPLEAMSCGVPTIVANNSSLPEIVGREDALFDASSNSSMASAMNKVLTDEVYRCDLREKGLERAKFFTWERSASLATSAWQDALSRRNKERSATYAMRLPMFRMAFVSPLPPERSGIADYSSELLRELGAHFEIDLFTTSKSVADDHLVSSFRILPAGELLSRQENYDIVVYQVGNSDFHTHMFDMMQRIPGVVVLHDFYLSGIMGHINATSAGDSRAVAGIMEAFGSRGVERWKSGSGNDMLFHSPCNEVVFRNALGVIVHSKHSIELLNQFNPEGVPVPIYHVPLLRQVHAGSPKDGVRFSIREKLGIGRDEFVVCSFGHISSTKCIEDIVKGFDEFVRRLGSFGVRLVFAGNLAAGEYANKINSLLRSIRSAHLIHITGFVEEAEYEKWLLASDLAIQLRRTSRGETSRAVLDSMSHGLPVIVNNYAGFRDYPADTVHFISTTPSAMDIADSLLLLFHSPSERIRLCDAAKRYLLEYHHPAKIAEGYRSAVFDAMSKARCRDVRRLSDAHLKAASVNSTVWSDWVGRLLADAPVLRGPRIFVDVTSIAGRGSRRSLRGICDTLLRQCELESRFTEGEMEFYPIIREAGVSEYESVVFNRTGGVDRLGLVIRFQYGDLLLIHRASSSNMVQDPECARLSVRGVVVCAMDYEIKAT